jgi:uncharacterized protein YbjQ (UPF0145 family)
LEEFQNERLLKEVWRMIITTTEQVPGYRVKEILGVVCGNVVMSKHLGRDIAAALKTLAGGEIKGYTEMLTEARNIALERMIKEAEKLGADAVIGFRYSSSTIMSGAAEILAYGTAVKLEKI